LPCSRPARCALRDICDVLPRRSPAPRLSPPTPAAKPPHSRWGRAARSSGAARNPHPAQEFQSAIHRAKRTREPHVPTGAPAPPRDRSFCQSLKNTHFWVLRDFPPFADSLSSERILTPALHPGRHTYTMGKITNTRTILGALAIANRVWNFPLGDTGIFSHDQQASTFSLRVALSSHYKCKAWILSLLYSSGCLKIDPRAFR
jgi:hypothetical protein